MLFLLLICCNIHNPAVWCSHKIGDLFLPYLNGHRGMSKFIHEIDVCAYDTQYRVLKAGLELHEPVYVKSSSLARQSLADFVETWTWSLYKLAASCWWRSLPAAEKVKKELMCCCCGTHNVQSYMENEVLLYASPSQRSSETLQNNPDISVLNVFSWCLETLYMENRAKRLKLTFQVFLFCTIFVVKEEFDSSEH